MRKFQAPELCVPFLPLIAYPEEEKEILTSETGKIIATEESVLPNPKEKLEKRRGTPFVSLKNVFFFFNVFNET